jgi:hypothetical protein
MPLSNEDRGRLEREIDSYISLIPEYVVMFRKYRSIMHFNEPDDTAFGYVLGCITTAFAPTLTSLFLENRLTMDMVTEVSEILFRRSADIRNKIVDAG